MLGNLVQVPEDMVKLHKYIYLTADLLLVNSIHFFITLTRKIKFTANNHLDNIKVKNLFKAFKDIYIYFMKFGLHITNIRAYG